MFCSEEEKQMSLCCQVRFDYSAFASLSNVNKKCMMAVKIFLSSITKITMHRNINKMEGATKM